MDIQQQIVEVTDTIVKKQQTLTFTYFLQKFVQWVKKRWRFKLFLFVTGLMAFKEFAKTRGWLRKKKLTGQHVYLTGAGSGLGKGIALLMARKGCKLTLTDINLEAVQKVADLINQSKGSGRAVATRCDVSSVEDVEKSAALATKTFGPVDILINNAGIVTGKKIFENNYPLMKKTMEVNTIAHL